VRRSGPPAHSIAIAAAPPGAAQVVLTHRGGFLSSQALDPRVPEAQDCVPSHLLAHWAADTPHAPFARLPDGTMWSYAQTRRVVLRTAAGLHALGVRQDDTVLVWLPNGGDALRVWLAINELGAVYVPINGAYRGRLLAHVVRDSGARLMIAAAPLVERLGACFDAADGGDTPALRDVVAIGAAAQAPAALRLHAASRLDDAGESPPPPVRAIAPWDTQQTIYTSGTTGPSKGVLCSYAKSVASESAFVFLDARDRYLVNLPLFHVSGAGAVSTMLRRGGSVALVDAFSTQRFWNVVRETGATCCTLLGSMANLLVKQAPDVGDRTHGLRAVLMVPLSEDIAAFTARFGCDVYTTFNMTETSCPIVSQRNPRLLGSCGRVREGIEARVVDDHDRELPHGEVGELIVRTDAPWSMMHGYHRAPEATAAAWRNGWFHTGDAFRRDHEGNYFFVDRLKDTIRRRGENISSFEVEAELCAHPAIKEAAAYAVPSDLGEDEVMAALALQPGATLELAELIAFLAERMAHFMVPRYLRVLPELPKTPTQKVQKHLLRGDGVTADSFDRVSAGLVNQRQRVPG
jgi:crotonobetaine/carnitine-CoA ligase